MDYDALMAVPRGPTMNFLLAFVPRRLRPLIMQLREDWKSHYSDWTLTDSALGWSRSPDAVW